MPTVTITILRAGKMRIEVSDIEALKRLPDAIVGRLFKEAMERAKAVRHG